MQPDLLIYSDPGGTQYIWNAPDGARQERYVRNGLIARWRARWRRRHARKVPLSWTELGYIDETDADG